jgi:hypothetical protein
MNVSSSSQRTMKTAPKVRTSGEMGSFTGTKPVEREAGEDEFVWKEKDTVGS